MAEVTDNETLRPERKIITVTWIGLPDGDRSIARKFTNHAARLKSETDPRYEKVPGLTYLDMFIRDKSGWTIQAWDSREAMLDFLQHSKSHDEAVDFAKQNNLQVLTASWVDEKIPDFRTVKEKIEEARNLKEKR